MTWQTFLHHNVLHGGKKLHLWWKFQMIKAQCIWYEFILLLTQIFMVNSNFHKKSKFYIIHRRLVITSLRNEHKKFNSYVVVE